MRSLEAALWLLAFSSRSFAGVIDRRSRDYHGEEDPSWLTDLQPVHAAGAYDPDYLKGPPGPDVTVEKSHIGKIPYGKWIYKCKNPGEVAITFDDGPYHWTNTIVEKFDDAGFKATFFITGFNAYRKIYDNKTDYPKLVRKIQERGHQLASHTWNHPSLEKIGQEKRIRQMLDNEKAFGLIPGLGSIPTYMRPPFGQCEEKCLEDMADLGYHVINWDIDTKDYMYNHESNYTEALKLFDNDLADGGSIVLCHDIKFYTADKLVPYMIKKLKAKGLKSVTVGQCLGDPEKNWYRQIKRSWNATVPRYQRFS